MESGFFYKIGSLYYFFQTMTYHVKARVYENFKICEHSSFFNFLQKSRLSKKLLKIRKIYKLLQCHYLCFSLYFCHAYTDIISKISLKIDFFYFGLNLLK